MLKFLISLSVNAMKVYGGVKIALFIPGASWSEAWVCGCSLAGIMGLNPPWGDGCVYVMGVMWCIQ